MPAPAKKKIAELRKIESRLDKLERRATAIEETELAYVIELARVATVGGLERARQDRAGMGRNPANDR